MSRCILPWILVALLSIGLALVAIDRFRGELGRFLLDGSGDNKGPATPTAVGASLTLVANPTTNPTTRSKASRSPLVVRAQGKTREKNVDFIVAGITKATPNSGDYFFDAGVTLSESAEQPALIANGSGYVAAFVNGLMGTARTRTVQAAAPASTPAGSGPLKFVLVDQPDGSVFCVHFDHKPDVNVEVQALDGTVICTLKADGYVKITDGKVEYSRRLDEMEKSDDLIFKEVVKLRDISKTSDIDMGWP